MIKSRAVNHLIKQAVDGEFSGGRTDAIGAGYTSGGYLGGYFGGSTAGAKWNHGLSSSGRVRVINHLTARRNSRDAYHDSTQAKAMIKRKADNVADTGLTFEPSPVYELLGISADQAEAWSC